jgi:hypothetical protein
MNQILSVERMFSDKAGECRVDAYDVPLILQAAAPPAAPFFTAAPEHATCYIFFRIPPGWVGELHPTPNPRLVICLPGSLRFIGGDGDARTLGAGDRLLDLNTEVAGPRTEVVSDVLVEGIIIRLD